MSRALMVRSIPLSSVTRNAWKNAGATFAKRTSTPERIERIADGRPIINLGNSSVHIEGAWNDAPIVAPLLTPYATRRRLGEFLPSPTYLGVGDYWLKGQGRGGANKEMIHVTSLHQQNELKVRARWMEGDVQRHIEGLEFRVITVGLKVVQVSRRSGPDDDRTYTWVGVHDTTMPVKEVAREATRRLDSEKTIIGWDVIQSTSSSVYILEGNSCPGVNEATANRILDAVEGIEYA